MSENLQGGYYDGVEIVVNYARDEGLIQQPVAAAKVDGSVPCRISRVHAPMMQKIVTVVATKRGSPPTLPNYVPNDPNLVALREEVTAAVPVLLTSGMAHAWQMACTYFFAMLKPLTFGKDNLPLGIQPYEPGSANQN